jgi:CcmD family protein
VDFLAQHQLFIVMFIVLAIWFGLFAYLYRLDRRITKLEKEKGIEGKMG